MERMASDLQLPSPREQDVEVDSPAAREPAHLAGPQPSSDSSLDSAAVRANPGMALLVSIVGKRNAAILATLLALLVILSLYVHKLVKSDGGV